MRLEKQLMALGLFRSGRYGVDLKKGVIISFIGRKNIIKTPTLTNSGYYQVELDLGYNVRQNFYVHQLIYLYKYGTYDPSYTIDHINNKKLKNNIDNLRAVRHSVNIANSNRVYKNNHIRPRKTEQEKQEMVKMFVEGKSFTKIADHFSCANHNVAVIIRNRLGNVPANKYKIYEKI